MKRNIQTTYYNRDGVTIQINLSRHARSAGYRAFDHLQMDHYDASVVEIFDYTTGELHAVLTKDLSGHIDTAFIGDPKKPTCLMID